MKKSTRILATLILAVGTAAAAPGAWAHGDVACPAVPKEEWKPQMELQRKLTDAGWRVRQVKVWNTCYEVYGFDAKGERVEAFFNPKTFERIEPKTP